MRWRLGLDLGTNSLGWWALALADELDTVGHVKTRRPTGSLDGGVLIFDDGREYALRFRSFLKGVGLPI